VGHQEDDVNVSFLAVLEELFRVAGAQTVHEEHDLAGVTELVTAFFDRRENTRSAQTSNKRNVMKPLAWITIVTFEALDL
jgi:PAB1-binding protein PBP1